MERRIEGIALALVCVVTVASVCEAQPSPYDRSRPGYALRLMSIRLPHFGPAPRPLDAIVGFKRTVVELPVHESTDALYLAIDGEVEFERADIAFRNGETRGLDLFGVRRTRGLYALDRFEGARDVSWVRVVLRSERRQSRIGIRLGRTI